MGMSFTNRGSGGSASIRNLRNEGGSFNAFVGVQPEPIPSIVVDGLILQLDASDNSSYAGSGTTWFDIMGDYDFTLINSPTFSLDGYFDFNGTNQYAITPHNSALKPTSGITMEQWVSADDWTAGDTINYKTSLSCTQGGGYAHYIWSGVWKSYVRVGGGYQTPTFDVSGFTGWHHFVTTFDGRYTKLYVDGVLVDTEDLGTSGNVIGYDPDNSIVIGTEAGNSPGAIEEKYWDGKISTTLLYNRALSDSEVLQNYNVTKSKYITLSPTIITDSLIIHLDAGNNSSYPDSGTTWTNLVDATNYTITNGTFDGGNGGSIVFNGTSTFVSLGTILNGGANFTKEAWVYADVVTSSRNILSSAGNVFWNNGSTLSGGVGDQYSLVTKTSFPSGVWKHVALTFNDTTNTMTLYIDGVEVNKNTNVTQSYIGSQTERIGAHEFGGNPVSFWDGRISIVRVYTTALSGTDILQNFNIQKTRYGL